MYFLIIRTVRIAVTPCGTQAILSLTGTPSNSSRTVKPSAKPSTQPRQAASLLTRTGLLFRSPSIPEQTSKKSLPDLLISGCSAVLFGPALPDELTKKTASNPSKDSKRMEPPSVGRFYFRFRIPEEWNQSQGWPGTYLVRRASSTGRCKTIQCIDSTMLPRKNPSVWLCSVKTYPG
jgi:hypothetical protein